MKSREAKLDETIDKRKYAVRIGDTLIWRSDALEAMKPDIITGTKEEILKQAYRSVTPSQLQDHSILAAMQTYSDQTNAELIEKVDKYFSMSTVFAEANADLIAINAALTERNRELEAEVERLKDENVKRLNRLINDR